MPFRKHQDPSQPELDRSIAAWRRVSGPDERLSPSARARILRETTKNTIPAVLAAPFRSLFLPVSRLALGAALPVAALSVALLALLSVQGDLVGVDSARDGHTRIEVSKSGDNIVFLIHNGSGPHTVVKSTEPGDFGDDSPVRVASGRYRDSLSEDSGIVYYRID